MKALGVLEPDVVILGLGFVLRPQELVADWPGTVGLVGFHVFAFDSPHSSNHQISC